MGQVIPHEQEGHVSIGRPRLDLAGKRFGAVVAIEPLRKRPNGTVVWKLRCDCGNEMEAGAAEIKLGRRKRCHSCGCKANRKYPVMTNTPLHKRWVGMISRCTYKSHAAYKHYGGRGITVCERWMDFNNFIADMGFPPPGKSLDRINNDGNYEPGNCRWATAKEQYHNSRRRKS